MTMVETAREFLRLISGPATFNTRMVGPVKELTTNTAKWDVVWDGALGGPKSIELRAVCADMLWALFPYGLELTVCNTTVAENRVVLTAETNAHTYDGRAYPNRNAFVFDFVHDGESWRICHLVEFSDTATSATLLSSYGMLP